MNCKGQEKDGVGFGNEASRVVAEVKVLAAITRENWSRDIFPF